MSAQNNNSVPTLLGQTKSNFKSYKLILTTTFLTLTLITILVCTGVNSYFNFSKERNLIILEQTRIAETAASAVEKFVDDKIKLIKQTAYVNNLITDSDKRGVIISKLIGFDPSFRQVILFNIQGKELSRKSRLSSLKSMELTTLLKKEIFSAFLKGRNYVGKVFFDDTTQEPIILIAIPAKNIFGDIEGALLAEINLKFMWDLVGNMKVGENGLAYVVDKSGNLIAFKDISRILARENIGNNVQVKQFVSGEKEKANFFNVSKGILNTWVISTFVPLNSPDWAVIVEIPALDAYKSLVSELGLSALVILLSSVGDIILIIYLSKRMTKPITDLTGIASKISEGDFSQKAKVESPSEIEVLANTFNNMTGKLQEYQKSLEDKVRDKTKDLEDKVGELEKFKQLTVGRELKMIELKKELAILKNKKE
jgi:methyl-accepting chemotaxis protein